MDQFSTTCASFGLIINARKTHVLHQPPPHHPYVEPSITANEVLNAVDMLIYLGSVLSRNVHIDNEADVIASGWQAPEEKFGREEVLD